MPKRPDLITELKIVKEKKMRVGYMRYRESMDQSREYWQISLCCMGDWRGKYDTLLEAETALKTWRNEVGYPPTDESDD